MAKARNLPEDRLRHLVDEHVEDEPSVCLGEPRVNVLALNLGDHRPCTTLLSQLSLRCWPKREMRNIDPRPKPYWKPRDATMAVPENCGFFVGAAPGCGQDL